MEYNKGAQNIITEKYPVAEEKSNKCLKGKFMVLIEHHIKYKEIHGIDETIQIEKGEHQRLHHRLRNEGKCNIPVDVEYK